MDWVLVLLPTALALRTFSTVAALLALGLLGVVALLRRRQLKWSIQAGPFLLLVASVGIVLARPEPDARLLFFALVALLAIRLVLTVDARVIIASTIDGAGLYLVVNVLSYGAGLRSPRAGDRIGGYIESSGFIRTLYPLSGSLDVAPTVASVYIGAAAFLIFARGWTQRSFRLTCFVAAIVVVFQAGNRTALFAAVALPIVVICFPFITRWIAQAATLFSSISVLILPAIISSGQSIIAPFLLFIAPSRDTRGGDIASLNSRESIWRGSINYWINFVDGIHDRLLGFGQDGQYRSGASMAYADSLASTVRHPERASMHNSFLQQLFDGGLVGWLLLTLAIFWASVRLSRRRRDWGPQGVAAIVAMVALLVNAATQVSIAPGFAQESFWLLVMLVGAASQSRSCERDPSRRWPNALRARELVERPTGSVSLVTSAAVNRLSQPHSD